MPDLNYNQAVIGVGSNIKPEYHVRLARARIDTAHHLIKESEFVFTRPVGFSDQPDFLNGAWLVHTSMDRYTLNAWLHGVEKDLKRVRTENKFGPRTIDLDIVVWNGCIIDEDVYARPFLKKAVYELLPDLPGIDC